MITLRKNNMKRFLFLLLSTAFLIQAQAQASGAGHSSDGVSNGIWAVYGVGRNPDEIYVKIINTQNTTNRIDYYQWKIVYEEDLPFTWYTTETHDVYYPTNGNDIIFFPTRLEDDFTMARRWTIQIRPCTAFYYTSPGAFEMKNF